MACPYLGYRFGNILCEGLHDFPNFVQEIRKARFNHDNGQFASQAI